MTKAHILVTLGFAFATSLAAQQPSLPTSRPKQAAAVSVTMHDADNVPWQGSAFMHLKLADTGAESTATANFVAGMATFQLIVDLEYALEHQAYIRIWPDSKNATVPLSNQAFFSAQDGLAAFVPALMLNHNAQLASFSASFSAILTEPPLYGTIEIQSHQGQNLEVRLADFHHDRNGTRNRLMNQGLGYILQPVLATYPVYRWSRSGAADVALVGPSGEVVVFEGILRNGGVLGVNPMKEVDLSITVDRTVHATAVACLTLLPQNQTVVPISTASSLSKFLLQQQRARRKMVVDPGVGQILWTCKIPNDGFVVELWGRDASGAYSVIATHAINAGGSGSAVVFN